LACADEPNHDKAPRSDNQMPIAKKKKITNIALAVYIR